MSNRGARSSHATPLVRACSDTSVFAHSGSRVVRVCDYLADVSTLAARLPDRSHIVNLCTDRYRFTVALGAALSRGQVTLLPPQRTPDFLARIARDFTDIYGIVDEAEDACPFELARCDLAPTRRAAAALPVIPAEAVAVIAFTSGTTGEPKPHRKTWRALALGAASEAAALGLDRTAGATLVGTVPPQHMYGLESTVLLALQAGLAMHGGRPFYPADVRTALEQVPAPRVLVTTPVHLRALELGGTSLPPLHLILSATAPLAAEAARVAERRHAAPVHEIYGFTEAGMVASRRTTAGSAWHVLPGVSLRRHGDTWYVEGGHVPTPAPFADLIEARGTRRFELVGRASDIVNVAGKRTSLAALNAHLLAVPGVLDGAYYVPAEEGATVRLGAFVVAPNLAAEALLAELRQRVDAAFLPRPLHFVDCLPRSATGKLTQASVAHLIDEQIAR